ncbi:MAG: glycoside hydrolase family 2 TIM barrel-domain containing protein [Candidatus Microbacterium stercoravium]
MTTTSFNRGWTVAPKVSRFAKLQGAPEEVRRVEVPHDALVSMPRSADAPSGGRTAYFPSGAFTYTKSFDVPENWCDRRVSIEFQGVYRDAMVFVNGTFAGQRPNGYSPFRIMLDAFLRYGDTNTIRVDARNHDDSRWYSGAGIHRDVTLTVTDLVHVGHDGIRVTTPDIDGEGAIVEVVIPVVNESTLTATARAATQIRGPKGQIVVRDASPITLRPGTSGVIRQRLYLQKPMTWSVDVPTLYVASVALDGAPAAEVPFGIRTIQADPMHGLRINGEAVKLRGACIHHDNGPLGAAAIPRAEERRIELLKRAGFNAIRSSHNPISSAMLDACDRMGMLVMDETFDMWTEGKASFDYSLSFPEWWERDVEALVRKDINHPSVIMYSIGNEVFEAGDSLGAEWGRALAEKIRALDPTRLVTNGINPFTAILDELAGKLRTPGSGDGVNAVMNMTEAMARISVAPVATERTESSFSVLDVAGMNYADARYEADREAFPNRVIVGSETYPPRIAHNWRLVSDNPHVIGDFTWSGWDYLGEVGIGRARYADEDPAFESPYPWTSARVGDIDVTGHRRPISYYREIVFGLRSAPYIAVLRPENYGRTVVPGMWAWSDSISSWTWAEPDGTLTSVEVYSDADEVELLLNGRSLGRKPAGGRMPFLAEFEVAYERGTLEAIAYRRGKAAEKTMLETAGPAGALGVSVDRQDIRGDGTDLAYLEIELRDAEARIVTSAEAEIRVDVTGPASLAAVASARPDEIEPFHTHAVRTFDGRAIAIVRPHGGGVVTATVHADSFEPVAIEIRAAE